MATPFSSGCSHERCTTDAGALCFLYCGVFKDPQSEGAACKLLGEGHMAENEQSGFHEGVTIPVRPVGAGGSLLQAGEGEHG